MIDTSLTLTGLITLQENCKQNPRNYYSIYMVEDMRWVILIVSFLLFLERTPIEFLILIGYGGIECHLSQLFNMSILHVEYRHTPEHSYPAAIDDTIAVYRALLQNNIPPSQLLFMGDSAGGGLALLTVQALLARELPVPRGVITISPWADLSISSESYTRNKKTDLIISADIVMWMTSQLLGPNLSQLPMYDPLISPLFGSFKGFPPLYVTVGTAEILEDDAIGVVNKAQDAGVDVTFEEGLHLVHAYPLFFPYFPEARNTLDNINKWIETIFTEQDTQ
jgi:acetyl esterase/lipase